ncbi:MAG: response regulator RpfG family c-di-GMP phosphodiesterase [Paracoccaceae bacterium]|jgi:response regulator RpfG family c-di-GMP phosphodiesterase
METVVENPIETGLQMAPRGNARRPLLGLTILLVEDSRYCSEAVRLLCQKSGARLRRADSQRAAYRHLATYRPSLVIVDIGLPDGSGLDLVRDLAAHRPNAPKILATSGDDPALCNIAAVKAGADGFMAKPLKNIKTFQTDILTLFPDRDDIDTSKILPFRAEIVPDELAIFEDLRHVRELVQAALKDDEADVLNYCAQFLGSVADANGVDGLAELASDLAIGAAQGGLDKGLIGAVVDDLSERISKGVTI